MGEISRTRKHQEQQAADQLRLKKLIIPHRKGRPRNTTKDPATMALIMGWLSVLLPLVVAVGLVLAVLMVGVNVGD